MKVWTNKEQVQLMVMHYIEKKTIAECAKLLKRTERACEINVRKIKDIDENKNKRRCKYCTYFDNDYCTARGKEIVHPERGCGWHETINEYIIKCRRVIEIKKKEEEKKRQQEERMKQFIENLKANEL